MSGFDLHSGDRLSNTNSYPSHESLCCWIAQAQAYSWQALVGLATYLWTREVCWCCSLARATNSMDMLTYCSRACRTTLTRLLLPNYWAKAVMEPSWLDTGSFALPAARIQISSWPSSAQNRSGPTPLPFATQVINAGGIDANARPSHNPSHPF